MSINVSLSIRGRALDDDEGDGNSRFDELLTKESRLILHPRSRLERLDQSLPVEITLVLIARDKNTS